MQTKAGRGQERTDRTRSRVGALLALVLLPFLLTVTACLKEPIGDPEKSVLDPRLSGAWLEQKTNNSADQLWIFQPFDRHAYQVGMFELKKPEDAQANPKNDSAFMVFKGWITELGGKRFLCLEPGLQLSTERGMKPEFWFAFQLPDLIAGNALSLQMVNGEKAGSTTKEIEEYIRSNIGKAELLNSDKTVLGRVDPKDYDALRKRMSDVGFRLR